MMPPGAAQVALGDSAAQPVHCAVCQSTGGRLVWSVDKAPLYPLRPPQTAPGHSGFGRLAIVECNGCGHLYNAAFDTGSVGDLYSALVLTNEPISAAMVAAVEATAALILSHAGPRPRVLEIGGGGGALSLALARQAAEVHLVEPSRAVTAERFAGTGVTLHQAMFPVPELARRRFDVVACRQVIEHVPEPVPFLAALRASLADTGIAYVELPDAGHIRRTGSVVDFHYPHVRYYRRGEIVALFARTGLELIDLVVLKEGHDVGFLLRAGAPETLPMPSPSARDFGPGLAWRREQGRRRLAAIRGPIALYGANAYSQAFLALYHDVGVFPVMFDDTPAYAGRCAYGPSGDIPIELPRAERLRGIGAVVITAYLHDRDIARKVRALGFDGPIHSVRADGSFETDRAPPSLFWG
jgi:2-polyprenyl-3-methyl-5-hydroxy-6-metoxy-1,4-benzoquinol methylase